MKPPARFPDAPARIKRLPIDHRGFPVPWFVAFIDGAPNFLVADQAKWALAVKRRLCWVCGQPLTQLMTFAIGPMCAVNRVTSEPPCHRECALFSVRSCPFLSNPDMRRNVRKLPETYGNPAGEMIERNPGVTVLWTAKHYEPFRAPRGNAGWLIELGEPVRCEWFTHGRRATRDECLDSLRTGLPALAAIAAEEGPAAQMQLGAMTRQALELVPA